MLRKFIIIFIFLGCAGSAGNIGGVPEIHIDPPDEVSPRQGEVSSESEGEELRLSFDFKGADLSKVLMVLANEYNVEISLDKELTDKVTLSLRDVTLDEALETILPPKGYYYIREGERIQVTDGSRRVTRAFPLHYADAEELADILSELNKEAFIKADPRTNTLIITDQLLNIKNLQSIIKDLDVKIPEIMIEAEMIEISIEDKIKLGTELGIDWQKGSQSVHAQSPFILDPTGVLITYGTLNPVQLRATLEALREKTRAQLLSSPRIVTLDGQEAKILVGERVPYVRRSAETAAGGFLQEVEFVDVGIKLKVTPRVSRDQTTIIIDVHSEVSEVLDKVVQGVPRIATQEATTRVAVKDGETVVIGGLMRDNRSRTENKIPIIGDIFLFGWLFKRKEDANSRKELIVFITPHILKDENLSKMHQDRERIKKRLKSKKEWIIFE